MPKSNIKHYVMLNWILLSPSKLRTQKKALHNCLNLQKVLGSITICKYPDVPDFTRVCFMRDWISIANMKSLTDGWKSNIRQNGRLTWPTRWQQYLRSLNCRSAANFHGHSIRRPFRKNSYIVLSQSNATSLMLQAKPKAKLCFNSRTSVSPSQTSLIR